MIASADRMKPAARDSALAASVSGAAASDEASARGDFPMPAPFQVVAPAAVEHEATRLAPSGGCVRHRPVWPRRAEQSSSARSCPRATVLDPWPVLTVP